MVIVDGMMTGNHDCGRYVNSVSYDKTVTCGCSVSQSNGFV